jgi:hypothetical protein
MTEAPADPTDELVIALTPAQLVVAALLIVVVMLVRRKRKRGSRLVPVRKVMRWQSR